jgi:fumarate reductase subunit D
MNNIFSDYPDIVGTFIIPMIIAIFAFAFPLLLQTISRIDDKYHSTKLVYTFRKDGICVWFLVSMVISIIASIVWLMQMPRLVDIEPLNQFIDNSALIFIGLSALSLIIATIAIIVLSYIYYVPEKLFSHMKNKYSKIKADKNSLYFEAISKLLFYSIQNTDKPLALETLYFYSDEFVKYRNDKEGQLIVYPSVYYDTVYEANELLFMRKTISVSYFNESALLGLFIDEYQKNTY